MTCVLVVNVIHPIDTIKTRIQVDPTFKFSTFFKQEGVLALWKGVCMGVMIACFSGRTMISIPFPRYSTGLDS